MLIIGTGCGLVHLGNKPLPEQMLIKIHGGLTHCGLVMLYGNIDLGHHRFS